MIGIYIWLGLLFAAWLGEFMCNRWIKKLTDAREKQENFLRRKQQRVIKIDEVPLKLHGNEIWKYQHLN